MLRGLALHAPCPAATLALVVALALLPAMARAASGAELIGSWGQWRAATHRSAGRLVCYAFTRNLADPARGLRRPSVLTVTERFGAPRDAVALSGGFAFPPGSVVQVTAGTARLRFYTASHSAFASVGSAATHAFRDAGLAVARSPAAHGRVLTDAFSLDGFSRAYGAIVHDCPPRA